MGDLYDSVFKRFTATVTFLVGAGTFAYEVLSGHNIEFAALAIGVMGAPFGKAIEGVLTWIATLRPTKRD